MASRKIHPVPQETGQDGQEVSADCPGMTPPLPIESAQPAEGEKAAATSTPSLEPEFEQEVLSEPSESQPGGGPDVLSPEPQEETKQRSPSPEKKSTSSSSSSSSSSSELGEEKKQSPRKKSEEILKVPESLQVLPPPPVYLTPHAAPKPPTEETILTKDKVDPSTFDNMPKFIPDDKLDSENGGTSSNTDLEKSGEEEEEKVTAKSQIKESALRLQDATAPQTGIAHPILRVMWILAYLGLLAVFIYQFSTLVKTYLGYPVSISIEIVSADDLEFPAVTVCNMNPVLKSLTARFTETSDLLVLDDFVMNEVFTYAEKAFSDDEFTDNCGEDEFTCVTSMNCIPPQWICNDIKNCDDGSDEELDDCASIQADRASNFTELQGDETCLWPYILCPNETYCAAQCDGIVECSNGYDESSEDPINCATCDQDLNAGVTPSDLVIDSDKYQNNLNCKYLITAQAGKSVQITFTSLSVEGEPGDCVDYLQVFDGGRDSTKVIKVDEKAKVCGGDVPSTATYTSTGQSLTIQFKTDSSWTEDGFTVSYIQVDTPSSKRRRREASQVLQKEIGAIGVGLNSDNLIIPGTEKVKKDSNEKLVHFKYKEVKRGKRTADGGSEDDESGDYDYYYGDYIDPYSDSYEEYLENFDEAAQFYNISPDNFYGLYQASKLPDYADFRLVVTFTQDFLKYNGFQKEDFIVQCTFDGKKCSSTFFKTFQDPTSGNCFSFNSIRDRNMSQPIKPRRTSKTGHEYGLKLTLFVNTAEYIGLFGPSVGAKVLIHDPLVPAQVNQQSSSIPVGQTTFVSMKLEDVEREGGKYGNCSSEWPDFLKFNNEQKKIWPKYNRATCVSYCIQNELAMRCNCSDGFDYNYTTDERINEGTMWYCTMTDQVQSTCRQDVYKQVENNTLNCDACTQGCVSSTYSLSSSQSPWPSESFAPYLLEKLIKSNSRRVVSYVENLLTTSGTDRESIREGLRKNFARLEIYFEEMNFQKMKESPSYTLTMLVTDFGGNIGLWLGWSVLCVFEVVQFLYEISVIGFNSCNKS